MDLNKKIDLDQFSGTENLYKDQLGVLITDGVKNFATEGECLWAVSDIIVICKMQEKVKKEEFVSVKIFSKDSKGVIAYEDGNGNKLFEQKYGYCSLPNGSWTLYYTNNTLLVPGEY